MATKATALRRARAQLQFGYFTPPAGSDHCAEVPCPDCRERVRVYRKYCGSRRETMHAAQLRALTEHLVEGC